MGDIFFGRLMNLIYINMFIFVLFLKKMYFYYVGMLINLIYYKYKFVK